MTLRLILARTLVNNPDLLILEEPTIGLDPQAQYLIWEKLKTLQPQGNTIVLTTHYHDEAARLCVRLVIMDHKKVLLREHPANLVKQHVGEVIVEVEKSAEVLTCLAAHTIPHEVTGDTVQIATDSSRDISKILFDSCQPKKMLPRPATLEDDS